MTSNWLEALIILVILIGITVASFKSGSANPVSTGSLRSKLTAIDADVTKLGGRLKTVETQLDTLGASAATRDDVQRIERRLADGSEKMRQLDGLVGSIQRDVARLETQAAANQAVIEAMAESLRTTNTAVTEIAKQTDVSAAITAQIPGFMERMLTEVAGNKAKTGAVCVQVDRLYHFITERGMSQ